jgi:hypothetical protein
MAPTLIRSSHSQKLVEPNFDRSTQLCSSPAKEEAKNLTKCGKRFYRSVANRSSSAVSKMTVGNPAPKSVGLYIALRLKKSRK